MAYTGLYTLGMDIDQNDKLWVVGQDLRMFDGSAWEYYNYQNSAVPSAAPYYLDTRTVGVDPDGKVWVGCSTIYSFNDTAVFYIDSSDPSNGMSWSFNDIGTFDSPMEVAKIYACPFGNDILAYLVPLGTSDLTKVGTESSYSPIEFWSNLSGVVSPSFNLNSVISPTSLLVTAAGESVLRSTDGGYNWTVGATLSNASDYFVEVDAFGSIQMAISRKGYWTYSSNNGSTWTVPALIPSYVEATHGNFVGIQVLNSTPLVVAITNKGYRTSSSVASPSFSAPSQMFAGSLNYTWVNIKHRIPGSTGFATGLTAGASVIAAMAITGTFSSVLRANISGIVLNETERSFFNPNYVIAVGASGAIYRSTVQGGAGTFAAVSQSVTTENLISVSASPTSNDVYVVGENGTIIFSPNLGSTWYEAFDIPDTTVDFRSVYLSSPASGVAVGLSGGVSVLAQTSLSGNGFLYRYDIPNDEWKPVAEGYSWPYIYDIKARGFGGNSYRYYLATNEGVIEIPGEELSTGSFQDFSPYVQSSNFYNSNNYLGLSDVVYSLDIDEDGNLWAGCQNGKLQFYNFETWESFQVPEFSGNVSFIKSRKNGHVFFGHYSSGGGLYHFNGVTASSHPLSGGNAILSIELQNRNRNQEGVITYENDLWILGQNNLERFTYEIPHVSASANFAGATGWDFTYYTKATGPNRAYSNSIPNVDKYTWEYPDWLSYQNSNLQYKFPGLDPRNLFLTTKLQDIASGEAGERAYWNSSPIPDYSDLELEDQIQEAKWSQILSNLTSTLYNSLSVYGTAIVKNGSSSRYLVCGSLTGISDPFSAENVYGIKMGSDIEGNDFYIHPSNPSYAASWSLQGGGTFDYSNPTATTLSTGFIVAYDEKGRVSGSLIFPGKSTTVLRMHQSESGDSVYVTGRYNGFIESGDFIWSSLTSTIGPTGAPIGLTNSDVNGLTSDYSWIYTEGATGELSTNTSIGWTYRYGGSSTSDANFRLYQADGSSISNGSASDSSTDIKYIAFGQSPASGSFDYQNDFYTGMVIKVGSVYFRIDSILFLFDDINSLFDNPIFMVGVTYVSGAQTFIGNTTYIFDFYSWNQLSFPLVRSGATELSDLETGQGIFLFELTPDLGGTVSLKDQGVEADWNFQVKNFRHFPAEFELTTGPIVEQLVIDSSIDSVSIAFQTDFSASYPNRVSLLPNKWERTTDYSDCPDYLTNSTGFSDVQGFVVMNPGDLSIRAALQIDVNGGDIMRSLQISSLPETDTVALGGITSQDFSVAGVTLGYPTQFVTHPIPFYFIADYSDPSNISIKGQFIDQFGTTSTAKLPSNRAAGYLSKTDGFYTYTNQFYGGSTGSYLGKEIDPGMEVQYLVTGFISPSNTVDKVVYGPLPDIQSGLNYTVSGSASITDSDIWSWKPRVSERGELVGFFAGSTSGSIAASSQIPYLFKQDLSNGVIETLSLGDIRSTSGFVLDVSESGDVFFSGRNLSSAGGLTGPDWIDLVTTNADMNTFVFLSKQYKAETGVNMGEIISRPGSNPWVWCDVHSSENGLHVPLMCTVFFSNYNSEIYGKQNNKWILSDGKTGNEILNVKNTPYFIYTFTSTGYYTIYNQVEDAYGNVYEVSKPGFIEVIDHKDKRADDPDPFVVNSSDYGYPIPPKNEYQEIDLLSKELLKDQLEYIRQNATNFSSGLNIDNDPDATFNEIS